ncbi:MAG: Molybdenum-dependent transcriptional regulator [Caulobacter sp.]|nr:Molybdenum-dependent transcriptional regulator [Caulobacter sp.]
MSVAPSIRAVLQLRKGPTAQVGPDRIRLLAAIAAHGSITAAAKDVGLSYKGAWDAVQALNNLFERPLVAAQTGGSGGGAAGVTAAGQAVLAAYAKVEDGLARIVDQLEQTLGGVEADLPALIWSLGMKTSARNAFRGVVETVTDGAVNAEVILRVTPGLAIVAVITRESVAELGLVPGREAAALIKSSFVILAAGDESLRTSARNALAGVVVRHERGAVNDEVVLELEPGKTLTATITRDSADALGLAVGARAQALIKASHVILAVD